MVARIRPGASISKSFFYNENKVEDGSAICLLAENYPKELPELNKHSRLNMLTKMAALNNKTTINSLHISLNFSPSENITTETYKEIAKLYMDKLGFGGQPFLVYQHFDAGHPHLHILTTNIEADGNRIDLHHLGIRKSEPARKEIEKMFNLVRAEGQKNTKQEIKSAYAQKIDYGKKESKKAIGAVLNEVVKNYKYTSLPELNAVLKQYNVLADRCSEASSTFKHKGLLYRILDDAGKPVGVPIKASLFSSNPTLKFLEVQFKANEAARMPHKSRIKNAIDLYFLKQTKPSLQGLMKLLDKDGIRMVVRQNETGLVYGLTYVDHKTKCVFNGSAIGKEYSAKAIQERCGIQPFVQVEKSIVQTKNVPAEIPETEADKNKSGGLLEVLMEPEYANNTIPYELSGKRKKKKRKGSKRL